MGKKKAKHFDKQTSSPREIFILHPAHEKIVTGGTNYGIFIILLIVAILFAIPVFLLHDDFPRVRYEAEAELISDAGFSGVSITFGLLIISIQLLPDLRLWRMRRNGQIIWGTTKAISGKYVEWTGRNRRGRKINHVGYDVTVYCQFKNPHGYMLTTHATSDRRDLQGHHLPQNALVAVLYISDQEFVVL